MAVGFVVEVDDMRLRMLVGLVLDEVVDGRHMGEGFHSELAVEAAT